MDLGKFSSIIEDIYEAAAETEGWQRLAPTLANLFDADSCILTAWDAPSGQSLIAAGTANFTPHIVADYMNHYRSTDLWLASGLRMPRGVPNVGMELVADNVLLKSEFYNDYLTKLSHFDILGGMMPMGGGREGFAAIHRPRGSARFEEADKRFLAVILPHLTQAMRLYQRLAGTYRSGIIATTALDAMPTSVIAVGADRVLLFANAAAERLLSSCQGLTVHHRHLHCTEREADRQLGRLIKEATGAALGRMTGGGGVLSAPRVEGLPLSLLVCPLRPEAAMLGTPQPMALIFIGNPDDRQATPAEMLTRLYGLTPAEARLTQALLMGDTLQDYAERSGVSVLTVKTLLRRVFAKTGTGRQAELVRDLLGNPVLAIGSREP